MSIRESRYGTTARWRSERRDARVLAGVVLILLGLVTVRTPAPGGEAGDGV